MCCDTCFLTLFHSASFLVLLSPSGQFFHVWHWKRWHTNSNQFILYGQATKCLSLDRYTSVSCGGLEKSAGGKKAGCHWEFALQHKRQKHKSSKEKCMKQWRTLYVYVYTICCYWKNIVPTSCFVVLIELFQHICLFCSLSWSLRTCGLAVVSWTARGGATEQCVAATADCINPYVPSRGHNASTHSSASLHEHTAQVHTFTAVTTTSWLCFPCCSYVNWLVVALPCRILIKDMDLGRFIQTDETQWRYKKTRGYCNLFP